MGGDFVAQACGGRRAAQPASHAGHAKVIPPSAHATGSQFIAMIARKRSVQESELREK